MCLVFDEGEDVLALASVYLLALPPAEVVEVGSLGFVVAVLSSPVLLPLCLGLPQHFEVFGDVFLDPWSLKSDDSLL